MSVGDDDSRHEQDPDEVPDASRRAFMALASGLTAGTLLGASQARADSPPARSTLSHHYVPANAQTVHWGYFSKSLKPVLEIESGDLVTLETVTHHAYDDFERMIKGDPGVESIFYWDKKKKGVNRRGAGPEDASVGVDFGITQVVDGNWGVHALIKKSVFVSG